MLSRHPCSSITISLARTESLSYPWYQNGDASYKTSSVCLGVFIQKTSMHNGSSSQTGTRYSNFFRSGLQAVSRERSRSFAFAPPTHTLPLTHIAIPQLNQRPLPPLPPLPPKDASPSIDDPSFTRRKVTVSGFSFVKRLKTFTKDFRLSLVLTKPISGKRRVEPVQTLRRKGSIRDRSFLTFDGPESPPYVLLPNRGSCIFVYY